MRGRKMTMPAISEGSLYPHPAHLCFWPGHPKRTQGSTHLAETIGKDELVIGGHCFSFGQNFH